MPLSNRKGKVTFTVLVAGILFIVGGRNAEAEARETKT